MKLLNLWLKFYQNKIVLYEVELKKGNYCKFKNINVIL